jgi:hypothetical protein
MLVALACIYYCFMQIVQLLMAMNGGLMVAVIAALSALCRKQRSRSHPYQLLEMGHSVGGGASTRAV